MANGLDWMRGCGERAGKLGGKPILVHSRVPVTSVLDSAEAGETVEEIADSFDLPTEQVRDSSFFRGVAVFAKANGVRVLFDQNVPRKLRAHLTKHVVKTARDMGWEELENGDLLKAAEDSGFAAFVTCDQNMRYQQNMAGRLIAILEITKNNWPSIEPHVKQIATTINAMLPGAYRTVECAYIHRSRRIAGPQP